MDVFSWSLAIATMLGGLAAVGFFVDKFRNWTPGTSLWLRVRPHSLADRLLLYVWYYPRGSGSQKSWAVKESEVLRGRLESARERPGLGVTIVSTELALDVFGTQGHDRVQDSIRWAIDRVDKLPPHFLPGVVQDSVVSRETPTPDFRHTLALAIVLARTKTFYGYLDGYVQIALDVQRPDGGWDPRGGETVSEVFTVFYAVELLHLCSGNPHFLPAARRNFELARDKGLGWLIVNRTSAGLWASGVLNDSWDDLLTTAWVLHRLSPMPTASVLNWGPCVDHALEILLERSMEANCWIGSNADQRNRVEARIAAAVARTAANHELAKSTVNLVNAYMRDWRRRANNWATNLSNASLDLATAVFLLEGLYAHGELVDHANRILVASGRGT